MVILHWRARYVGWVSIGMIVLTLLSWRTAEWLSTRDYFDGARARPPVAAFAPLIAVTLLSVTFNGADDTLERSTSKLTARRRLVHVSLAVVLTSLLLGSTATSSPHVFGSWALVRNTMGLLGIVLLAILVLPASLTWGPALVYSVVVYVAAPRSPRAGSQWWAWLMQPGGFDSSWVAAVVILTIGSWAYALRGPGAAERRDDWS